MQVAEVKTSSAASPNVQAKRQPFFNHEGYGNFFSKSSEPTTSFFSPNTIQPKLTIGQPNDKYEVEADAMADKVVQRLAMAHAERPPVGDAGSRSTLGGNTGVKTVQPKCTECAEEENLQKKQEPLIKNITKIQRKPIFDSNAEQPDANVQTKPVGTAIIQTKCASCEADEENIQTKSDGSSNRAGSDLQSRLNSNKGGGNPLSPDVQKNMGSTFGSDFSTVRIHTGREAVQMNKELNAQAFTHGSDIYFNRGKYDTNSNLGKHLLAHELTHTIQQTGGLAPKIQRLGDLSKVPSMACDVANSSSLGSPAIDSLFPTSSTSLSPVQKHDIATFVLSWQASGGSDVLRVDGYASTSGKDELNWKISCQRAISVANELHLNGVPNNMIEIFAQGETTEFGPQQSNQRSNVLIKAAPPIPVVKRAVLKSGPTYTPNRTIKAKLSSGLKRAKFDMKAEFKNDPANGIYSSAGEIRQYMKWSKGEASPNHKGWKPSSNFKEETWYEDRDSVGKRYGHRKGVHSECISINHYEDSSGTMDCSKQLTQPVYKGQDTPGGAPSRTGKWFFRMDAIDTINGNKVLGSDYVTVSFS